jgi:hypothetical protein
MFVVMLYFKCEVEDLKAFTFHKANTQSQYTEETQQDFLSEMFLRGRGNEAKTGGKVSCNCSRYRMVKFQGHEY